MRATRSPPGLAGGVQGSWSLIRQPAACDRSALPDSRDSQAWSLSLSLSLYLSRLLGLECHAGSRALACPPRGGPLVFAMTPNV